MKRWLGYGLLLLGLGLWFLFDSQPMVLALWIATAVVPGAMGCAVLAAGKNVRLRLNAPDTVQKGQEFTVTIHKGSPRLLCWVDVTAELVCRNGKTGELLTQRVFLDGKTTELSLQADHCGPVALELDRATLSDSFGLWHRRLDNCRAELVCLPDLFPMEVTVWETAVPLLDADRYSPHRPGNDPSETFGLREYAPGDSVRQIHWKLSEKNHRTMIRELGLPVVDRLLLMMDTIGTEGADGLTEAVCSLSLALICRGITHTLAWNDPEEGSLRQMAVSSREDAALACRRLCSLASAQHGLDVAASFLQNHRHCGFSNVVVAALRPSPAVGELFSGNRVTILSPAVGDGLQPDGTVAVCFDPAAPEARLQRMEV